MLLLCSCLATVVLLEGALQIGAYVVWRWDRKPKPEMPPGQNVVLCVGDSWTHGMGSSDALQNSYPAVLQRLLRERGREQWTVVNGGQSGQNSRDVLQRLPSQLAEFRPRVVCVLVGQNDFWSVPDEIVDGAESATIDHDAFRFRWRVPRLVAWLHGKIVGFENLAGKGPSPRGPEWTTRKVPVQSPYGNEAQKWPWNAAARAHQLEGWRLNAAKDVPGGLQEFELAFAACPDDPRTRQMLASLYRRDGRQAEATQHLQWLVDAWARDGDYWVSQSLVAALNECGRNKEALDVVVKVLARYPKDAMLWRYKAQAEFDLGRHQDARISIEESLRFAPDPWTYFSRYKIHYIGLHDVDEGLRSVFLGYVVFNDAGWATDCLRAIASEGNGARLRPVLQSFACAPDVRARLGVIVDEVLTTNEGTSVRRVLSAHLRRIATAARNAGATPVFLTYPVQMPAAEVLRAAAQELGAKCIEVGPSFRAKLGTRRWEDVRAPDGHCNDEGYHLMAEVVAEGLVDLVGATGR